LHIKKRRRREEGTPSDEVYIIPQKQARLQNSGVGEYLQGFLEYKSVLVVFKFTFLYLEHPLRQSCPYFGQHQWFDSGL